MDKAVLDNLQDAHSKDISALSTQIASAKADVVQINTFETDLLKQIADAMQALTNHVQGFCTALRDVEQERIGVYEARLVRMGGEVPAAALTPEEGEVPNG